MGYGWRQGLRYAAVWTLALAACGPDLHEAGRTSLRGGAASDRATVVALMGVRELPREGEAPLRVSRAIGSGVLLCPNLVLTVQHVADFGPFSVTTRPVALSSQEVTGTDATGARRQVTVRVPIAEDARQVGEPIRRTLAMVRDAHHGELPDGLALLRVEPAFPADLDYPAISTVTDWEANEVGEVHGYGPSLDDESDTGQRRKAEIAFLQLVVRGPQAPTRLLAFRDERSVEGDSGGPIFGPMGRAGATSVAGLDVGTLPGQPVSLSFDLAANADWLRTERDRLCPERSAWAAPDEGPLPRLAWSDAPAEEGALATTDVDLAGGLLAGDELVAIDCVCDGDCETSCPPGEPVDEPAPVAACADYDWGCFCVACDGWDDTGDGCCGFDEESGCVQTESDPACEL